MHNSLEWDKTSKSNFSFPPRLHNQLFDGVEWQLTSAFGCSVRMVETSQAMSVTNSSFLGIGCTPIKAASLPLGTMRDTNSSFHSLVGTPIKAASLMLPCCAMSDAYSSLHSLLDTSVVTAKFMLLYRTMSDANSSLPSLIGTTH